MYTDNLEGLVPAKDPLSLIHSLAELVGKIDPCDDEWQVWERHLHEICGAVAQLTLKDLHQAKRGTSRKKIEAFYAEPPADGDARDFDDDIPF